LPRIAQGVAGVQEHNVAVGVIDHRRIGSGVFTTVTNPIHAVSSWIEDVYSRRQRH
jgi:hypothetical protein